MIYRNQLFRLASVPMIGLVIGLCVGLACGAGAKSVERGAVSAAVDCTTADRAKLEAQFGPVVEQAILRATGGDGKIDLPSLQQIGAALEADGWCVLERAVADLIAAATMKNPSAPAAAAAPLEAAELAAQLARMRVQKFGATQFQLGPTP